jgi:hypothetical protein
LESAFRVLVLGRQVRQCGEEVAGAAIGKALEQFLLSIGDSRRGPDVIPVSYTRCGLALRVEVQYAGRSSRCPTCKQPLVVPNEAQPYTAFAANDRDIFRAMLAIVSVFAIAAILGIGSVAIVLAAQVVDADDYMHMLGTFEVTFFVSIVVMIVTGAIPRVVRRLLPPSSTTSATVESRNYGLEKLVEQQRRETAEASSRNLGGDETAAC